MKRLLLSALLLTSSASASTECMARVGSDRLECPQRLPPPPAHLPIRPLSPDERARMTGVVWHPGCPLSLDALSDVTVPYVDPAGRPQQGELIVATQYAQTVQSIFIKLYEARFPIARMEPIVAFKGDDHASMAANNTSAFNCRPGPEKERWSRHAYGDAIDVNPLWNPQVRGDQVKPPEGSAWRVRTPVRPGMNVLNGTAVRIFRAAGWHWGGRWPKPKDYQHFSVTGR